MCYNGKCLHCISIKTGSLIFAVCSIILLIWGCVLVIGEMVYVNYIIGGTTKVNDPEEMQIVYEASLATNIVLGVLLCLILIPFAFTIVLIKGILEEKASLVKVYFIFFVVSKSLFLFGVVIGFVTTTTRSYLVEHAIILLTIFVFSGLILRMIYLTYKKLEVDSQFKPLGVTDSPLCRACMETDETPTHVLLEIAGVADQREQYLQSPASLREALDNLSGLLGFWRELWLDEMKVTTRTTEHLCLKCGKEPRREDEDDEDDVAASDCGL